MARSIRNEAQRPWAPVEVDLPELAEIVFDATQNVTQGAALENLELGHAGLRNACWFGANGMGSGSYRVDSLSPGLTTRRLRRPPRRNTPLHCVRPSQPAEARFTPSNGEFLTF
jgi:hypothetical protein